MLENPMVIDGLWVEEINHWEDDRTDELIEEYAGDNDIIAEAVARWMMAESVDDYKASIVYENMPARYQTEMLVEYIEANNLTADFNTWFEGRLK